MGELTAIAVRLMEALSGTASVAESLKQAVFECENTIANNAAKTERLAEEARLVTNKEEAVAAREAELNERKLFLDSINELDKVKDNFASERDNALANLAKKEVELTKREAAIVDKEGNVSAREQDITSRELELEKNKKAYKKKIEEDLVKKVVEGVVR